MPTGFTELDEVTNGLHPGQMIVVAARPGMGKALALDTPLPTPTGWTTMGEVAVGDYLMGADGQPTLVVAATEVMVGRPCFEVEFSDGTVIVADAEHQWPHLRGIVTTAQLKVGTDIVATATARQLVGAGAPAAAAIRHRGCAASTQRPVRCVEVDNDDHLYLAGRAMIPTHNSTLGLDFLRSCSIKNRMASVVFSLEMSKSEIVMRLLSAEAKIKLADMRSGRMSDDDWTRLARRMSEISEAPLFIDDSPNLTMMEIRAKARRLKQKPDLRLVVIDYLQLMTSGKKVESRQQEVSEFSRQLKLLAKELEVPVVAMSQLNRGPEQRTDKKPMLADLRESGCLTGIDANPARRQRCRGDVRRADAHRRAAAGVVARRAQAHGGPADIERVLQRAQGGVQAAAGVRPGGRGDRQPPVHDIGRLDCPWATWPSVIGWRYRGSFREPVNTQRVADEEVILLAHMIGDGSCVKRQPIRYASIDEENLAAVGAAAKHFGVTAVRDDYPAARVTTLRLPAPYRLTHGKRNPIAAWLDGLGLFGKRSYEKFVPSEIFALPNDQVALFLRHLWATDGSVRWDAKVGQGRVYYASTSRRLIDDVAQLLLRVGVFSRIKRVRKAGYRDSWHLYIYGAENQLRFLRHVGVNGAKDVAVREVISKLARLTRNTNRDTVPKTVWTRVRDTLADRAMTHREFAAAMNTKFCGSTMWKHAPSRDRLHRVSMVLEDRDLHDLATNDVFWDEIVEIASIGHRDVYDGTVPGTNNFVAQGISAHNSLEQDADMVILLHRPDAFERDDPRGGEADLILGKHRNGPTKTVTVAHQLHLSRFTNMAK